MDRLIARNISVKTKDALILNDVSANFEPSSLNLIIGKNGSGKTQFLKTLLQLVAYSGHVKFGSTLIDSLTSNARAKLMCWLPTHVDLPFEFSCFDVIMMGRFALHEGRPEQSDFEICHHWIDELGLRNYANRNYNNLSKGEQTKIQLARCIASESKIMLLDEICANLDISATISLLKFLRSHAREFEKTIILSHHDIHTIYGYGDHIICLKDGMVIAEGSIKQVFTSDLLEKCYDLRVEIIEQTDAKIIKIPSS